MVSVRCKMVVKTELEKLGLHCSRVELGEVDVCEELTPDQQDQLRSVLLNSGLELMEDKNAILIERIKNIILEIIHYSDETPKVNFSDLISQKLNHDYSYLANLFSKVTGLTIEHYIITHKIERVKELLTYYNHNLTEISYMLNYSSVAHLSSQFKKVTGLSPTFFRQLKVNNFRSVENV